MRFIQILDSRMMFYLLLSVICFASFVQTELLSLTGCPKGLHRACSHAQDQIGWFPLLLSVIGTLAVPPILVITYGEIMKTRKNKFLMDRRSNFETNGGKLLEREIRRKGSALKIYTTEDMNSITDNFIHAIPMPRCKSGVKFCSGTLFSTDPVVVETVEGGLPQSQIKGFVDLLIFLSKPRENLVRVLGCCLEMSSILIVYERHGYGNTTLCNLTRGNEPDARLSREMRVKAAAGVARGLAHIDSRNFMETFVRGDICGANIMMNASHEPKIFCSAGSNHISRVPDQDNGFYTDPNHLNKRSGVYSFGVVLVELLMAGRTVSPDTGEFDRGILLDAIDRAKANNLLEILDGEMVGDGPLVGEVVALAHKCLKVVSKERPKMKKVPKMLKSLMKRHQVR